MTRLPQRIVGVVAMLAVMFTIDLRDASVLHTLVLPLVLAAAAYLVTQSLMAVALAALTLAAANTDLSAASWVERLAYPAIAAVSGAVCAWLLVARFRERIKATRAERWAHRR